MTVQPHGHTPEAGEADDITRVNIKELQGGPNAARNLALSDGDTIYVPRAQVVYVFGQVKNPGSYPVQPDTTVVVPPGWAVSRDSYGSLVLTKS